MQGPLTSNSLRKKRVSPWMTGLWSNSREWISPRSGGAEGGAVSVGVPWAVGTPDARGDPPLSPLGRVLLTPWAQAAPLMTSCTGEPAAPGPSLLGVPGVGAASAAAGVSVLLLILLVLPPWSGRGFLTSQCGAGLDAGAAMFIKGGSLVPVLDFGMLQSCEGVDASAAILIMGGSASTS